MIQTLNNPVTRLRGPRFLEAWNIHILCNLLCAMRGITTRINVMGMHTITMHETYVGTWHVQLTCIIELTNMSFSP